MPTWAWTVALVLASGLPAPAQTPPLTEAVAVPRPDASPGVAEVAALISSARTGDAVLRCEGLQADAGLTPLSAQLRKTCARAHVAHGDRLYALGALKDAKAQWHQSLTLDDELLDDPSFVQRRNALSTRNKLQPLAPLPYAKPTLDSADSVPNTPLEPFPIAPVVDDLIVSIPEFEAPTAGPCPVCPEIRAGPTMWTPPEEAPGPRTGRGPGVGLGAGYDGLAALVFSWMHDEMIAIEASAGLVFPTLEARLRFYGVRKPLTPVFGVGMLTPFGTTDYFDADVQGSFPKLYEHGTALHVDIGVSYAPWRVMDIYAGVSFLTTLDASVEMLLFFPHWSAQTVFYF